MERAVSKNIIVKSTAKFVDTFTAWIDTIVRCKEAAWRMSRCLGLKVAALIDSNKDNEATCQHRTVLTIILLSHDKLINILIQPFIQSPIRLQTKLCSSAA